MLLIDEAVEICTAKARRNLDSLVKNKNGFYVEVPKKTVGVTAI